MFAEVNGRIWLAEWAVDRALAEATAAQLGFEYEPEPPFAGRKGRSRLAVGVAQVEARRDGVDRRVVDVERPARPDRLGHAGARSGSGSAGA